MSSKSLIALILVEKPVAAVWEYWTAPQHIMQWNIPFDDWYCPVVENELKEGGRFCFQMKRKDGTEGFDHTGIYNKIIPFEMIVYTLDDERKTVIEFQQIDENTILRERFEPEAQTGIELQQEFCQSVLNRFKNYVEQQ